MGVIQRQATKQTIVNYTATGIAALATILVYPNEEELYGLWLTLFGMASFFMPFASLGINAVTVRFFPRFKDPEADHQGFLPFLLGLSVLFFSLFAVLFWVFQDAIFRGLEALLFDVEIIRAYLWAILALTLITLLYGVLTAYISNFQRIVVPGILTNLWPKVALPILVSMAWFDWITPDQYVWGLLIIQGAIALGLLVYLAILGELRIRPRIAIWRSGRLREMATFGLYGMLGSLGSIFAFRIDHVMITMLVNVGSTGIYGIAQFIGNSIEMPTRSIYAIAGPIIAKAWEENNLEEIRMIYHKSSLNLLLLGLPLYGLVLLCLDDLFSLTAQYEALSAASWVVYLIGAGKLVDMACSVNGQIIGFSKYFRFNLVAILVLGVVNVLLNYYLIPKYGIIGAAWASFIAITAFNLIRSVFVWWRFDMQPFSWRTGMVLLLAAGATAIAWVIPDTGMALVNIPLKVVIVGVVYLPAVIGLKLSKEFNALIERNLPGKRGGV